MVVYSLEQDGGGRWKLPRIPAGFPRPLHHKPWPALSNHAGTLAPAQPHTWKKESSAKESVQSMGPEGVGLSQLRTSQGFWFCIQGGSGSGEIWSYDWCAKTAPVGTHPGHNMSPLQPLLLKWCPSQGALCHC